MILRELSPAQPGCINDLHSIFEALREGQCALGPLMSLIGHQPAAKMLSSVGGIAGKLALNVGDEGVLVAKRSVLPLASVAVRRVPLFGSKLNDIVLSGNYDLPGGMIEPSSDRTPMTGLFREAEEEGLDELPMFDKKRIMLGCYAKATVDGVQAVVRMGVAAATESIPEISLSSEHTSSKIITPDHPDFPAQWQELGDAAMDLAA